MHIWIITSTLKCGMDKLFYPMLYLACDYLSTMGFKLINVSEISPRMYMCTQRIWLLECQYFSLSVFWSVDVWYIIALIYQYFSLLTFWLLMFQFFYQLPCVNMKISCELMLSISNDISFFTFQQNFPFWSQYLHNVCTILCILNRLCVDIII